jgi:pyruvate kinase
MSDFPRIICTLGKSTDDATVIAAMRDAGMGLARINTAYATLDELRARVRLAHEAHVPVMLDLKGPQLRVDCTTDKKDADGTVHTVPVRYPIARGEVICVGFGTGPVRFNHDFSDDLEVGDLVTFDNGTIRTRVVDGEARGLAEPEHGVLLEVLEAGAGKMTPQMGANVPGKRLSVPHLSDRDLLALQMGIEERVEHWALSFVRDATDVRALAEKVSAPICAKIEEQSGIDRLEEIVTAGASSIMIARGDLFVELPRARLPRIQQDLIRRCKTLRVPSIVATGLLLSMQTHPTPARSEVADVAAALTGGADSLMLSDETSNSQHPVEAVRALAELWTEYGEDS